MKKRFEFLPLWAFRELSKSIWALRSLVWIVSDSLKGEMSYYVSKMHNWKKLFHLIFVNLLGYVFECIYLRKFGYLRCRYELEWLGVKFRGDGFLGEIWLPNMIVAYKCYVIATYHYCLQMFWFSRSWEIFTERMVAYPISISPFPRFSMW